MATAVKKDVRDVIMAHLKADQRSLRWLSEKTGYNYNTLYSIFVQRIINISDDRLETINFHLGTKFKK